MAVYKESNTNTWRVVYRHTDWTGKQKQSSKRGFVTKREALAWEREQLQKVQSDLSMTFAAFVELYCRDMKTRLRQNTWQTKENIINKKLLPYFGNKRMSDIAAKDIIQWQNEMMNMKGKDGKPFSATYLKSLHNQVSAIFNHAVKFYDLKNNPAAKAGSIGKKEAKDNNKMSFGNKVSNAQVKSGAKIGKLGGKLGDVQEMISQTRLPEDCRPKFILDSAYTPVAGLLSISFGECGYGSEPVLTGIFVSMDSQDKIAINGDNASGKTTFIRAIMQDPAIWRKGDWELPKPQDIGYLEQHYNNLDPDKTVEDIIKDRNPTLDSKEIRKHLNAFLFRKNEEVFAKVKTLSGGEKARLSLAQIAAKPPKLLILDEITNNVDIETKQYIATVLQEYPGAMIIISHEESFLDQLPLTAFYAIHNGTLKQKI